MEYFITFINDVATDLFYDKFYINGRDLFLRGGCYEFYKIVKHFEPSIELYIHKSIDHCAFLFNGSLYDSTGIISDTNMYRKANSVDLSYIEEYFGASFINLHLSSVIVDEIENANIKQFVYEKIKEDKKLK